MFHSPRPGSAQFLWRCQRLARRPHHHKTPPPHGRSSSSGPGMGTPDPTGRQCPPPTRISIRAGPYRSGPGWPGAPAAAREIPPLSLPGPDSSAAPASSSTSGRTWISPPTIANHTSSSSGWPKGAPRFEATEVGVVVRVSVPQQLGPPGQELLIVAVEPGQAAADRLVVGQLGVGGVEQAVTGLAEPDAEVDVVEGRRRTPRRTRPAPRTPRAGPACRRR